MPEFDNISRLGALRDIALQCRQCSLYESRHKLVFGDGSPTAWVMFIGEAPGREEDLSGIPFCGRSGRLLRNMIAAIGLESDDWYIANILKDRPPANRVPEPEEIACCIKFLHKQIDIIRPQFLVLLGKTAVKGLLPDKADMRMNELRDESKKIEMSVKDIPVLITYHPSALLRDPSKKALAAYDFRFIQALGIDVKDTSDLPL